MSLVDIPLPRDDFDSDSDRAGQTTRRGAGWLQAYGVLTVAGATLVVAVVAAAVQAWSPAAWLALALVAFGAVWVSGGAATALLGLVVPQAPTAAIAGDWRPTQRTAVLVLLCGEDAEPVAAFLKALRRRADRIGLADTLHLFVLSDTADPARIAAEEAALAGLIAEGRVTYRRRVHNTGHKPGNIADWLATHGNGFSFMAVLDADSRMTADRIRTMIHRMEAEPRLGLLQTGMAMVRGRSLFGRHQRLASRLLSPNFGRGLAAWSGDASNYWGHNAIIRTAAFRCAVQLPVLSGRRPFGGPPLSHDFVEAAWIRRDGWTVVLDPDPRGSAEDAPQTLAEFHRRDRRWCQGNLQHIRLISEPGLDLVSRLHLASGIASYLVAPAWLALVLLIATGAVAIAGSLPLLIIAVILLVPKLCALAHWQVRTRTPARRRLVLRASVSELCLSTLIAPLVMLRQSGAVMAVLLGRDCGWKSRGGRRIDLPPGLVEVVAGAALLALGLRLGASASALWLLPVALPLMAAPLLQRWLARVA